MKQRTKADREIRSYIRFILDQHRTARIDTFWEIQATRDILDSVEKYYIPKENKK